MQHFKGCYALEYETRCFLFIDTLKRPIVKICKLGGGKMRPPYLNLLGIIITLLSELTLMTI